MSLSIARPLLLLLFFSLPAFYYLGRERLSRLPTGARRAALATRLAIAVLIIAALSAPSLARTDEHQTTIFLVDTSDSISPTEQTRAREWVRQALASARPDDQAAVITFAAEPRLEHGLAPATALLADLARSASSFPTLGPGTGAGTDIAAALHLAQALVPPTGGRRIVLLSDGRESVLSGQAADEARYLGQQSIQLSVVPLVGAPDKPDARIDRLDLPEYARLGETLDLGIEIGYTAGATDPVAAGSALATLSIELDGTPASVTSVELRPGANRFTSQLIASSLGFHEVHIRVAIPNDAFPENDEGWAWSVVKPAGQVVVIAARPAEAEPLRAALAAAGIGVEIQPPSFIPSRLAPLMATDAVVLLNVPATSLTFDQMKTLTELTQSRGHGLVVVGGDQSLSLGKYADTPLADALPVLMNVPGGGERGNVGLVIVLDRSGSMGGLEDNVSKLRMAREAARKAVDQLQPSDVIGVVAFDTFSQVIVPAQRIGDAANRDRIAGLIDQIDVGGGTDIRQALESGLSLTSGIQTRFRHIILLSDGRPNSDTTYDDLVNQMRGDRITLSTIAIGSDADLDLMESLAKQGQGRYYYAEKAKDVPTITMREARIASGPAQAEGRFPPKVAPDGDRSPLLRTLSEAQLPALDGYVVTIPRDGAQVDLLSQREDPVLAHWYYGLGRVVTWTSDLTDRWTSDWLRWPSFGSFWARIVRWSMRSPGDPNMRVSSQVTGSRITLRVDVVDDDGAFQDLLDIRAVVRGGGGQLDELRLGQTRPGHYEASLSADSPGVYQVDVVRMVPGAAARSTDDGEAVARRETAGFVVSYPAEYRNLSPDPEVLGRLAGIGGGAVLRAPIEAFDHHLVFVGQSRTALWPYLLALATLLFPLDVGIRRLKISPSYLRRRLWLPVLAVLGRLSRLPRGVGRFIRRHRPR